MRLELAWFVIAERMIIGDDNNLTVVSALEQVATPELPAVLSSCWFGAMWYRVDPSDQQEIEVHVRVMAERPGAEGDVELLSGALENTAHERVKLRVQMPGLKLTKEGRYFFRLEHREGVGRWTMDARVPLTVIVDPSLFPDTGGGD